MRGWAVVVLGTAVLTGCGSLGSAGREGRAMRPADRVERCVDRLVSRSTAGKSAEVRRYVRDTYCARFVRRGWVYEDGVLTIGAQHWLENGQRCATAGEGEPPHTVSCQEQSGGEIECALLHVTRKSEVTAYLARLQRTHAVHCDDGTPLGDLGVP